MCIYVYIYTHIIIHIDTRVHTYVDDSLGFLCVHIHVNVHMNTIFRTCTTGAFLQSQMTILNSATSTKSAISETLMELFTLMEVLLMGMTFKVCRQAYHVLM